jgi:hypothetical protein
LAFSERSLDPFRIIPFVNEFAMDVLITGHSSTTALPAALSSSSTMKFTGIVHFSLMGRGVQVKRFERIHPTSRPNGASFPPQCPKCLTYCPWVVPSGTRSRYNKKMVFACVNKGCTGKFKAPRLKGYWEIRDDKAKIFTKVM